MTKVPEAQFSEAARADMSRAGLPAMVSINVDKFANFLLGQANWTPGGDPEKGRAPARYCGLSVGGIDEYGSMGAVALVDELRKRLPSLVYDTAAEAGGTIPTQGLGVRMRLWADPEDLRRAKQKLQDAPQPAR